MAEELRLVLWRGQPQRMLRLAPTRPAAAPRFLQPPAHTSLLSCNLSPFPCSPLGQSHSLLTYHPSSPRWFVPSPLSSPYCFSHSPSPASQPRVLKPQGKDCVARHHFTWSSKQAALSRGWPEHASVIRSWLVSLTLGFSLPLGLQSCNIPLLLLNSSFAGTKALEKLQPDSCVRFKTIFKSFSNRNNIFKLIVFLN